MLKFINALVDVTRKEDNVSMEKLEYNKVRTTIEEQCEKYLSDPGDIFEFEALPNAIDATLACLDTREFMEKYEFSQISETCFLVRMKELDIL